MHIAAAKVTPPKSIFSILGFLFYLKVFSILHVVAKLCSKIPKDSAVITIFASPHICFWPKTPPMRFSLAVKAYGDTGEEFQRSVKVFFVTNPKIKLF